MENFKVSESIENATSAVAPMQPHFANLLEESLKDVFNTISPVWPLKDYVAVNPYFGINHRSFMDARSFLKVFSDSEMLMPLAYYAEQFQQGEFSKENIGTAIDELINSGTNSSFTVDEIAFKLSEEIVERTTLDQPAPEENPDRRIRTIAEIVNESEVVNWVEAIGDEVSKYCATHYDEGQASWTSPYKDLPLYQAWREIATKDRSMGSLGMTSFRKYVSEMPYTPEAAILYSLKKLEVPQPLWTVYLLCQAFSIPGWSAWTKYQDAEKGEVGGNDFAGLLAIRLAYDAALSESLQIKCNWDQYIRDDVASFQVGSPESMEKATLRYILLRASEVAFRDNLIDSLSTENNPLTDTARKTAQMVFCIDVRSERIRRQIEAVSSDIETFGFAGFFGMPLEFASLGENEPVAHLPVLLKPKFQVKESLGCSDSCNHEETSFEEQKASSDRIEIRSWRKLWRSFQTSAVGCFSFVETTGIFFGVKLLGRVLGLKSAATKTSRFDGISSSKHDELGPTLDGLLEQNVSFHDQVDMAEGMLKNLGLIKNFAKLVVFCGHASQTDNNPLASGLDCGACGGHSGEPNARFAALLLNNKEIRTSLAERGILIPEDTHFLGGLHNTTTDQIEFFDLDALPANLQSDFDQIKQDVAVAGKQTCEERMPIVDSNSLSDLMRRSGDWSEVRPEWGLSGNAAFIVAPRSMTKNANLDGRSFLHSYDHNLDAEGSVLESIMTAPMVVANWINMQYYASTVDNHHFGSGNKTVHNVVGRFGVLSGNGGDLMTGLPWQSLHTGDEYQHLPMRLQVVVAAPRESIVNVIEKHELVSNLITKGWLHMVAIEDDGSSYRYTENNQWQNLSN